MIVNTCSSLVSTWEICINWIVSEDLILAEWLHLTERMLVKTDGASPWH